MLLSSEPKPAQQSSTHRATWRKETEQIWEVIKQADMTNGQAAAAGVWGVEQEEEDQERNEMVRGPEQDLHHSPLDQVCRLTHEPPV